MTEQEISEGNKLILEFEGYKFVSDDIEAYPTGYYYKKDEGSIELKEYQFYESWDWLMPVVEKIENLGYDVRILRYGSKTDYFLVDIVTEDNLEITCISTTSKIESVYKAVVKFIKWYNNEQINKR